ncbi:MAG: hypothetical protein PHI40_07680 [Caldisericia bacterium]|nr:hypothetical protein [Caldisericia bacterium]
MIKWIKANWIWIAAGAGLLILIIGTALGYKLAQALGAGTAIAAGAAGAGKAIMQPDPATDRANRTVQDTLDAKERRLREAERIRGESRR